MGAWRPEDLVADLQRYVAGDYPIYPTDDPHCVALHRFLFAEAPDPRPFRPLLGPHDEEGEVSGRLLRRDVIASTVVTSFMRRAVERPDDPWRDELYDAMVYTGVHFAFDPAYGEAHTETSVDVGDFLGDWRVPPDEASRAALRRHLPALVEAWRGRVTNKGTSSFFGIVLRHLGREGAEALVATWGDCNADERFDLLARLEEQEELGPGARGLLVDALLDPSLEVRSAALAALRAHGAPVDELDPSLPDDAMEAAARRLRTWAGKTGP